MCTACTISSHAFSSEIINDCEIDGSNIICLTNNFEYAYKLSNKSLKENNIQVVKFNSCTAYMYGVEYKEKYVCRDFNIHEEKSGVTVTPNSKQYFTKFNFSYVAGDDNSINSKIINGYSLFAGKNQKKLFSANWDYKIQNFEFKNRKIRVKKPIENSYASMSFKNDIPNSFKLEINVESTNLKIPPRPIFVINKELFVYINSVYGYMTVDFPISTGNKQVNEKIDTSSAYQVVIKKQANDITIFINNDVIYSGKNVLKFRQWSSFEVRAAKNIDSYFINKLNIFGVE